ncbi:hypothetical protein [Isobaculum melis]|uniref:Uncharacterized protein n=1 Tax=Isobaculum melis TaxID=142588 RepID=A0A1H9TB83_9LACT|nr:hypothetical protein [Isobaculum melis]SER94515.1 hypothetical protein SAMN04488559_11210 [Isobaculum melis]
MKKTIGILSIVIVPIILFQSMIVGAANTLSNDSTAVDGSAGVLLAVCLLVSGILVLASKKSRGTLITAIVFYTLGGLIGLAGAGIYRDLVIWSVISLIFATLLLVFQIIKPKRNKLDHK